jgi:hypothetical protein
MQPSLLLMSKIVVLCLILTRSAPQRLPSHFIPLVSLLRSVGTPLEFHRGLQVIFTLAAMSLFLNRWVRAAAVVAGGVVLIGIASSLPTYGNNLIYTGLILVLAGLHGPEGEPWLLRCQVVLLYLAAALNKVLLVDWRDGYFMSSWLSNPVNNLQATWTSVSGHFPPRILATWVSWAAIIIEFALALGFALRRLWPLAIWVGATYHTTNSFVTDRTFNMFWVSAIASYLAFVRWPTDSATVRSSAGNIWWRLLRVLDLEGSLEWQPAEMGFELTTARGTYQKWHAASRILLRNPLTYFALAVVAYVPRVDTRVRAGIVMLVLLTFAVGASIEAFQRRAGSSRTLAAAALTN